MKKSSSKPTLPKNLNTLPVWLQIIFAVIITLVPVALLFGLVVGVMSIVGSDSFTHYALAAFIFSLLFIIPAALYAYLSDKDHAWEGDVWVKARTVFALTFLLIGTTALAALFLSDPASNVNELRVFGDRLNLSAGELLFVRDAFAPSIIVAIVALITSSVITNKRTTRSSRRAWLVVGVSFIALMLSILFFGRTYL